MKGKSWFLFFFIFFRLTYVQCFEIPMTAESVILINAKTGKKLFAKNAETAAFPASTTKIATALYALHLAGDKLERKMVASQEAVASISPQAKKQSNYRSPAYWLESDGTHIGIKRGEELTFRDLLYAILVASANDAANVVAQNLGGSITQFMENLNKFLLQIGCKNTSFNNPHGLHHPEHQTSAADLALIAKEALKNPLFRKIVSTVRYTCPETNLETERTFVQTNLLLRNGSFHYAKAIGVKTGTTNLAGKNIIAAAEDENRSLIAVVLNHKGTREELYREVIRLFDKAFNEKKMRTFLLPKGVQTLTKKIKGAKGVLKTHLPEGLYYDFYPSEEVPVKAHLVWEALTLPIVKDQPVACVRLVDDAENIIKETHLLASNELRPTLWYKIAHAKHLRKILFILGACVFMLFVWKLRRA